MTELTLQHYLAIGTIMFAIGVIGFMARRNLIIIFLSTELMFQGIAIDLIAFGRYRLTTDPEIFFASQAFVIFVLVVAAAEAATLGPFPRGISAPWRQTGYIHRGASS